MKNVLFMMILCTFGYKTLAQLTLTGSPILLTTGGFTCSGGTLYSINGSFSSLGLYNGKTQFGRSVCPGGDCFAFVGYGGVCGAVGSLIIRWTGSDWALILTVQTGPSTFSSVLIGALAGTGATPPCGPGFGGTVSGESCSHNFNSTVSLTNPVCRGGTLPNDVTFNTSFSTTLTFNANNVFTVQLSDESGDFSSPTNIGSLASSANSGTISATIPFTIGDGDAYRIRTVSTNPVVIGNDNGSNLSLKTSATSAIIGGATITQGSSTVLGVNLTGSAPWNVTIHRSVPSGILVNNPSVASSPYTYVFNPSSTSSYTSSVSNACGAGTNQGLVTIVVLPPCPSSLSLTSPGDNFSTGVTLKQAQAVGGSIMAGNVISGNAQVTYQAANTLLVPNFQAAKGTVFLAQPGGCN